MYPQSKSAYPGNITKEISFDFAATGFALRGAASKKRNELSGYENPNPDYELTTWDYITNSDRPFTASYSKKK